MDTPNHTPQPGAEQPPAAVERAFSVEEALETRGFQAFYDRTRPDGNVFDNPKDTEEVFKTFELSKSMARRFEVAMNTKLREQNKGTLKSEERQAYKEYVERLATENPEELLNLENDLNTLEAHPAQITQKETELASLRETLKPEKFQAEKMALEAKKEEIKRANADRVGTAYSFLDRTLAKIGKGKKVVDAKKQKQRDADWDRIDTDIKALELKIAESPGIIAKEQMAIKKIRRGLEDAQAKVFMENEVAQKMRERLLKANFEEFNEVLDSADLGKRQKVARKFKEEVALEEKGSGYLSGILAGKEVEFDREGYIEKFWEGGTTPDGKPIVGMKTLFEEGIKKAIDSLPLDAGQSRVLRAYRTFMRTAGADSGAIGFMDEAESNDFVLKTLEEAEEEAKIKHAGTGKRIYYQVLIRRLKGGDPITP